MQNLFNIVNVWVNVLHEIYCTYWPKLAQKCQDPACGTSKPCSRSCFGPLDSLKDVHACHFVVPKSFWQKCASLNRQHHWPKSTNLDCALYCWLWSWWASGVLPAFKSRKNGERSKIMRLLLAPGILNHVCQNQSLQSTAASKATVVTTSFPWNAPLCGDMGKFFNSHCITSNEARSPGQPRTLCFMET